MKNYSSVRLEVTSRCNLHCEYCHNAKHNNSKDDMTTEQILKLVRSIKSIYPINKILLTGGEPLANDDICEIIQQITDLGIKADMVSNGTMFNLDNIKLFEEAGLKRVRLSIDEIGEKSDVRFGASPNQIWDIAKMIKQNSNIEVCIHTVCTPQNANKLFDIYLKVLEIGAARWRVFDIGYQGGITEHKNNFDFENYYDDLIASTQKILTHYISNNIEETLDIEINNIFRTAMLKMKCNDNSFNIEKMLKLKAESSPCDYVTNHQITVRSNGKATLCQYFHNVIFDFNKYNFCAEDAIKNKNSTVEDELQMKNLNYCLRCKYCLVCNSGCRSRTLFLTGDITDADPVSCCLASEIHKKIISVLPKETQKVYDAFINYEGIEPKYNKEDLKNFLKKKGYC